MLATRCPALTQRLLLSERDEATSKLLDVKSAVEASRAELVRVRAEAGLIESKNAAQYELLLEKERVITELEEKCDKAEAAKEEELTRISEELVRCGRYQTHSATKSTGKVIVCT